MITPELMTRYKGEMMGLAASGAYQVPPSAAPWTARRSPARHRPVVHAADDAPDLRSWRPSTARRVTPALIREARRRPSKTSAAPLPWTPKAEARLVARREGPTMMADFVLRLFQRDVEVEARQAGLDRVTGELSTGSGRRRRRRR